MTLTRIIPSLRRTLPDPLVADLWPEATTTTVTDVVVAGISLVRLAEVSGTPCGFAGASVIPHTGGRPSATSETSVRVVRITGIVARPGGELMVETDGELDPASVVVSELRLIGRASTAYVGPVLLAPCGGRDGAVAPGASAPRVELPNDLRVGDLLAVPCCPVAATWTHEFVTPAAWLSTLE